MDKLDEIRQETEELSFIDNPAYIGAHGKEIVTLMQKSANNLRDLLSEVDRLEKGWQEALALANTNAKLFDEATARAEAAEARADAAIADLNHLTYEGAKCEICKHYLDEDCITCEFEWRGQEAGKGDAPNE